MYVSLPFLCFLSIYTFKESKGQFLHELVNEGGEKEKLEDFVNFCEDTIFEVIEFIQAVSESWGLFSFTIDKCNMCKYIYMD